MRKVNYFLGLICVSMCFQALAVDPFDRTQRQAAENPVTPLNRANTCTFKEPTLAAESAFEQLKLVGVVLYKQQPETLFLDMRKQLVIAKPGYRLGQEGYLLQKISKQGVQVLRPKQGQCEQAESVDLRF